MPDLLLRKEFEGIDGRQELQACVHRAQNRWYGVVYERVRMHHEDITDSAVWHEAQSECIQRMEHASAPVSSFLAAFARDCCPSCSSLRRMPVLFHVG
jgi:hypothetical protein